MIIVPYSLNNHSYEKSVRVIRSAAAIAALEAEDRKNNRGKSPFFNSAAGVSPSIFCSHETAWSGIFIEGDLDGGTVIFEIGARGDGAFFPYPGPASPGANIYGISGHTAVGFYGMERLFGNNYGRIKWSGCGEDADFFVTAAAQMV